MISLHLSSRERQPPISSILKAESCAAVPPHPRCAKNSYQMKTVTQHRPHIESAGMADTFSTRASRCFGIIRRRVSRDLRSRFMMWRPSGESVAMSIPRERGGVGERDVRGVWIDHHPSGESKRPAFRESATESQSESCGVPRSHHVHSARAIGHPTKAATIPSLSSAKTGDFLRHNKPRHPTPTSRPVSMISRCHNLHPIVAFRPRW